MTTTSSIFFVLADDFNLYALIGALTDLESFIATDKNFSSESYYPAAFNFGRYENISYALPCESTLNFMFVNKTLLALPVHRDVIISAEAQEIFAWESSNTAAITPAEISEAMNEAIMPFKFKNYNTTMIYANSELTKIIEEVVPLNNALNKLQKEITARLQY